MAAATEGKLADLHDQVATVLGDALCGTQLPTGEFDDAGNAIMVVMPPASNTIVAAIQFLKNNNITCAPAEDNAIGELAAIVAARAARAQARREKASTTDLALATEAHAFASGLPN